MTSPSSLPPDSSSSSPSPSPSPPFRPFSRLPTELVRHIVGLTDTRVFHSTTYGHRQKNLCLLSLVSRLSRQLAQPLLPNMVSIPSQEAHDRWVRCAAGQDLQSLHSLVCVSLRADKLSSLSSNVHNLMLLIIKDCQGTLDLSLLGHLCCLTTLRISAVEVSASQAYSVPCLKVLQIMDVYSDDNLDELLTPTSVPGLRALAVYYEEDDFTRNVEALLGNFASQLDVLSLDQKVLKHLSSETIGRIQKKTLFDTTFEAILEGTPSKHVRIFVPGSAGSLDFSLSEIIELEHRLHDTRSPPSLLYLPSLPVIDTLPTVGARMLFHQLSSTCKARGVTMIDEDQPSDWALDSGISEDFWRRMKARRME